MQFYIIHPDPQTNARMLPDYALKSVNVREGFAIISAVCSRFGIEAHGLNKPYNPWHPLTRSLSSQKAFARFILHYANCCSEYLNRYEKPREEIKKWAAICDDVCDQIGKLPADEHEETKHYLLTMKAKHLTKEEMEALG